MRTIKAVMMPHIFKKKMFRFAFDVNWNLNKIPPEQYRL